MRHHCTPTKIAKSKQSDNAKVDEKQSGSIYKRQMPHIPAIQAYTLELCCPIQQPLVICIYLNLNYLIFQVNSSVALFTVPELNIQIWLVATVSDNTNINHFHHCSSIGQCYTRTYLCFRKLCLQQPQHLGIDQKSINVIMSK